MRTVIFSISILALISKCFGFFRDISLSYYFGASDITDAYIIATIIPTVIFNFVGLGLNSSFIPVYSEIKNNFGENIAFKFASNFLNFLFLICIFICIFIFLFTEPIVKIFASGFTGHTLKIAILYTKICVISIFFSVIIDVLAAVLQVNNKFYVVAFMGIPMNIIYMFGNYLAFVKGNIYLPIMMVVAIGFQMLILILPSKKIGYTYSLNINFRDEYLKKILTLSIPVIISGALEEINYLVDRTLASRIYPNGGVTILNYANRINLAIIGIFISSVIAVVFPRLSKYVIQKRFDKLERQIQILIRLTIILMVPITMQFIFFSNEIVGILFKRGNFTVFDVGMTATCLQFYMLSFFAISLRQIALKIFYVLQETKRPLINSSFGMIINIILNIFLSKYMGIQGLALATSISIIFTTFLLLINLNKYQFFSLRKTCIFLIKSILCSCIMIVFIILVKEFFVDYSEFMRMLISGSVGGGIYILIVIAFNLVSLKELKEL